MANERQDDRTLSKEELIRREERLGEQRERGMDRDIDIARGRSGGGPEEELVEPAADDERRGDKGGREPQDDRRGSRGQRQVRPPEDDEDFNVPADGAPGT